MTPVRDGNDGARKFDRTLPGVTSVVILNIMVAVGCPPWHDPPSLKVQGIKVLLTVAFCVLPSLWAIFLFAWCRNRIVKFIGLVSLILAGLWLVYAAQMLTRYFHA